MKNSFKTASNLLLIAFYLNIIVATVSCYIELGCPTLAVISTFLIPIIFSVAQITKIISRMLPERTPQDEDKRPPIERYIERLKRQLNEE